MADFTALKNSIRNYIKQNGNAEITGEVLQNILISMVVSMGDGAINGIADGLANEGNARTNADGLLQNAINSISAALGDGYTYAGIATSGTTPISGRVFYLALQAGTYTNFGGIVVTQGINILKNNDGTWQLDNVIGIDDVPTAGSPKLVKSGGVFANMGAFDISDYNKSGSTLATYADLTAALAALPSEYQKGGMSVKFIQSSDNKYIQYFLTKNTWSASKADWEKMNLEEEVSQLGQKVNGYHAEYDQTGKFNAKYKTNGDQVEEVEPSQGSVYQIIADVIEGATVTIYGYGDGPFRLWAFVDASGNILSKSAGYKDASETPEIVIAPVGSKKLYSACYNNYLNDWNITINLTSIQDEIDALNSDVEDLEEDLGGAKDNISKLSSAVNGSTTDFDSGDSFLAKYETNGDSVTEVSPAGDIHQIIADVSAGQNCTIQGYGAGPFRLWAFADEYGHILSRSKSYLDASVTPQVVIAPANATKLYAACYYNYISSFNISIVTESQQQQILDINDAGGIILKGKKVYFIGDSVMEGRPNDEAILNVPINIQRTYKGNCTNLAKAGSEMLYPSVNGNAYSIYYQLTQIPNDADYIIIQGGLNAMDMSTMGSLQDEFDITFDKTTQIGCLEAICQYLYSHFAGKKYGFIMNYEIGSYNYWKTKAAAFMQVLDKWSIPVLDWRKSGISLASQNLASVYGLDSWADFPQYDENEGYAADERVIYNTYTYKANEAIPAPAGPFDSSKWTLISTGRYDTWHCNGLAYKLLAHKTGEWMKTL